MLVMSCLALAGCSQPAPATKPAESASPTVAPLVGPTPVAAKPTPPTASAAQAGSRVLAKKDFALRGKPACKVSYRYAGHAADTLFWEEPCAAVTAKMMTQPELAELGKWDRLDESARTFVAALPGGKVLYVEGSFSASVYPIGTTGSAYEVSVAD